VALWNDTKRRLIAAAYVPNPEKSGGGPHESAQMARAILSWAMAKAGEGISEAALEYPRTYSGRASRGDANDLFPLAAVDGALAALLAFSKVKHYTPSEWKGGTQKPDSTKEPYVVEAKVRMRLSPEELSCIEWPGNVKHGYDIVDSVGIGLHHLGRFERLRVYARE